MGVGGGRFFAGRGIMIQWDWEPTRAERESGDERNEAIGGGAADAANPLWTAVR